jgi:hypothetical protein
MGLAPKSEFLIGVNHVVLGILAVIMRVRRWLELRFDAIEFYSFIQKPL